MDFSRAEGKQLFRECLRGDQPCMVSPPETRGILSSRPVGLARR
ncbi:hypothetical protein MES5069_350008 [Mesorhizobium escarrei]|uniref:Uncharacterized protein n=1 Tax=Mesorhizobium escarrei TaxID=666018 RepID=A0ABN8K0F1_9HYPH|nr:hypothetical protein MES5069_350008 [Mesorhizobium escarrei]